MAETKKVQIEKRVNWINNTRAFLSGTAKEISERMEKAEKRIREKYDVVGEINFDVDMEYDDMVQTARFNAIVENK